MRCVRQRCCCAMPYTEALRRYLVALVVSFGSSLVAVTPAWAVGQVTVQADDLRLSASQECGDAIIRVTVPYDIPDWTIDLTVYAPDGSYAGSGYYFDGADPNAITEYVNLCADWDGTGTFTVVADVEARHASYNSLGNYRVTDHFEFQGADAVQQVRRQAKAGRCA